MSTCFDIYTLPSGCGVIQTYPSALHPPIPPASVVGGAGGPYGESVVIRRNIDDDESILAALGLFGPRL